ncbi:MAG: GNAT family N-acetyltransferase [Euryarchaeota archaeon]|jgi:ribosomal protein S18 acetylase RimI-like enzyme|nr:GNAT family N-acetyltransferase [Euryarchaeota archaeon]
MKFEKFDMQKHNLLKVAELIYEADTETFDFFFSEKEKSTQVIEKLVLADVNTLNHQHIYVVVDGNNQVLGAAVIHHGKRPSFLDELKSIFKNMNLGDSLKYTLIFILDSIFLSDLEDQDSYLAILTVDESVRSRGIGSFILKNAIHLMKEHGSKRMVLDVDIENPGALRLYEKVGFRIFNKKSFSLLGWKKGVFNMEFISSGWCSGDLF